MTFPALLHKPPSEPLCSPRRRLAHLGSLGTFSDDYVVIHCSNKASEPHIITISCTDQLGLACDIARTIFEFCLDVVQADFSIDGKWCLLLFWVTSRRQSIDWALLKERLVSECPSPSPSSFTQLGLKTCPTEKKIYLLQICSGGRLGILNDIVYTLWKLELEVLKVNALTSPNGSAVLVFLLRDIRSKVQGKRKETIGKQVKSVLGASISFLELSLASVDDVNGALDLEMLHGIPDELLSEDVVLPAAAAEGAPDAVNFSLSIDNSFSSAHTILQITCRDRRGLLYDCLRASSDLNLQGMECWICLYHKQMVPSCSIRTSKDLCKHA